MNTPSAFLLYAGALTLSPLNVALACAGDQLEFFCSTEERFLEWGIVTPQKYLSRLVPASAIAQELEPLFINDTVVNVTKTSSIGMQTLMSTLLIGNVTIDLNGTIVNCSQITQNGQTAGTLSAVIHTIRNGNFF